LPAARAKAVAVVCNSVWKRNEKGLIPYALSQPNDFFDPTTGELLLGPNKVGLTCTTFVLAIFKACNINLVDFSSWEIRQDDEEWKSFILEQLQSEVDKGRATQEHIQAVRADMSGARFRPAEVMAASFTPPECNTMAELEPISEQVQAKADAWLATLAPNPPIA
jgi:hypothetical protein